MKNFQIQKYFGPEAPRSATTKAFPELAKLKLSPEQERSRAKAIAKLDEYINDISKFSRGNAEAGITSFLKDRMTKDSTMESIQAQMKDIRALLLKEYASSDWNAQISTNLNRIEGDGSANLETIATTMSKRVFLQRIIGGTEAGKILKESTPEAQQLAEERDAGTEIAKRKSRLEQFLLAIEDQNDGMFGGMWKKATGQAGLDSQIRHTQSLLAQGKYTEAETYAKNKLDGKWSGVSIKSILESDLGLANALRAMKKTDSAEKVLLESVSDNPKNKDTIAKRTDKSEKFQDFYKATSKEKVNTEVKYHLWEARDNIQKAIAALPYNDPDRLDMQANTEKYVEWMASALALKKLASEYIKSYGPDGLPEEMKVLNDMRGLHWKLNFTDENARLCKEIAILALSMVATMGASAAVAGVAWAARGAAVLNAANGIRTAASLGTVGTAVAQGVMFTSADALLRHSPLGSFGDKKGFANFLDNTAKNTVMFASFAGMEKFLTSEALGKVPVLRAMKVDPSKTMIVRDTIRLSTGDIAVLQALHAAETGKLETDWKALAAVVAFRGMTQFPNLLKRFRALPKQEQEKLLAEVKPATEGEKLNTIAKNQKTTNAMDNKAMIEQNELLQKLKNPRKWDSVDLPNGEKWNYSWQGNKWQKNGEKVFKDGKDLTNDIYAARQAKLNTSSSAPKAQKSIDSRSEELMSQMQKEGIVDSADLKSRLENLINNKKRLEEYISKNPNDKKSLEMAKDVKAKIKLYEEMNIVLNKNAALPSTSKNFSKNSPTQKVPEENIANQEELINLTRNPKRGDVYIAPDKTEWKYNSRNKKWQKYDTTKSGGNYYGSESLSWRALEKRYLPEKNNISKFSDEVTAKRQELIDITTNPKSGSVYNAPDWSKWLYDAHWSKQWQKLDTAKSTGWMNTYGAESLTGKALQKRFLPELRDTAVVSPGKPSLVNNKFEYAATGKKFTMQDKAKFEEEIINKTENITKDVTEISVANETLEVVKKKMGTGEVYDVRVKWAQDGKFLNEYSFGNKEDLQKFLKERNTKNLDGNINSGNFPLTAKEALSRLNALKPNLGDDAAKAIAETKNGDIKALKNFFQTHWIAIASGTTGLALLRDLVDREKINPFMLVPKIPNDPQAALEVCLQCLANQPSSTLSEQRIGIAKKPMTFEYRQQISEKFIQNSQKWQDLLLKFENIMTEIEAKRPGETIEFQKKFNEMAANPTPELVQSLQQCIGMAADDNSDGQDGILGPKTTKHISDFLDKCRAEYGIAIASGSPSDHSGYAPVVASSATTPANSTQINSTNETSALTSAESDPNNTNNATGISGAEIGKEEVIDENQ